MTHDFQMVYRDKQAIIQWSEFDCYLGTKIIEMIKNKKPLDPFLEVNQVILSTKEYINKNNDIKSIYEWPGLIDQY
jgi:hypothetical protein